MKVLLINPPNEAEIAANNPAWLEAERGRNPPLGLLYIAAYLQRHAPRHEVAVFDAQVECAAASEVEGRLRASRPEVVGLTAMTLTLLDVMRTVEAVGRVLPEAKVVLGGAHAHLFPDETVALPGVDVAVLGEGEATFCELLATWEGGGDLRAVKGIAFRDSRSGRVVRTDPRPAFDDLDALPHPDRRLTPWRKYSSLLARRNPVTTVFTSRGCPYRCAFCDRPHMGRRFRALSAENVVDELDACVRMGIAEFLIYDDTFTVDRERVLAICAGIRRRGLEIGFDIRARVDTVDAEMLAALSAAGCRGIHYGVEAGTEAALAALRKGIALDQVRAAFALSKRYRIPTLAYFMIGNPGEGEREIRETFRLMGELDPDYVHLTVLIPFPGTEIYAEARRRGLIDGDPWRDFAAEPDSVFVPPHWPEHLSRDALDRLLVEGYRSFYLRPRYILRQIRRLRTLSELRRKAVAALRIFGLKPA